MPLVAVILGYFGAAASSLVGRVLLALGMGYVTYKGFNASVDFLLNEIKSNINGMPADVISFLAFLWVDKAIGMVFAAYSAALLVKVSASGTITKLVTK